MSKGFFPMPGEGDMTIGQLIDKLSQLPREWMVNGTNSGSLYVSGPDQYGWVFTDDRDTRLCKHKNREEEAKAEATRKRKRERDQAYQSNLRKARALYFEGKEDEAYELLLEPKYWEARMKTWELQKQREKNQPKWEKRHYV